MSYSFIRKYCGCVSAHKPQLVQSFLSTKTRKIMPNPFSLSSQVVYRSHSSSSACLQSQHIGSLALLHPCLTFFKSFCQEQIGVRHALVDNGVHAALHDVEATLHALLIVAVVFARLLL